LYRIDIIRRKDYTVYYVKRWRNDYILFFLRCRVNDFSKRRIFMRKGKIVALVAAAAMALSACGAGAAKTSETTAAAGETKAAAEASEKAGETEKAEEAASGDEAYAIVLKTQSSQFWQDMKAGIEDEAKKLNVTVDIQSGNTEDDVEGQVTILENFISSGKYKAIGVAPISDVNLNNAIAQATKAGIVVVDIDEKINADALGKLGGALSAYVATDNQAVGKMAGEELTKQLEKGSEVAIIEGKAGAISGEQRRDGAKAAFEEAGMKLVDSQPADWDRTKAFDVATNMMNAHPDLKAFYACNDTMALGIAEAVKKAGKDILVCGTDGDKEAISAVDKGEMTATVAQDPKAIGAKSLDLLVEAVKNGEKPEVGKEFKTYGIEAILINKDNAKSYLN
jgi:hypothetical protein